MKTLNERTKKGIIETRDDLSVAFKDKMYFGVEKNEGKRGMERIHHNAYAITGYFQKDRHDAKAAAFLARSERYNYALKQAWSNASNKSIFENIADTAKGLVATATASVKNFVGAIDETITAGVVKLKSGFNDLVESGAEMVENGYDAIFAPSGYKYDFGTPALAYNYMPAIRGVAQLNGNSIASNLMLPVTLTPQAPTPALPAPTPRMA